MENQINLVIRELQSNLDLGNSYLHSSRVILFIFIGALIFLVFMSYDLKEEKNEDYGFFGYEGLKTISIFSFILCIFCILGAILTLKDNIKNVEYHEKILTTYIETLDKRKELLIDMDEKLLSATKIQQLEISEILNCGMDVKEQKNLLYRVNIKDVQKVVDVFNR